MRPSRGSATKHPQYRDHALEERPIIRVAIERVTWWGDLAAA